MRCTLWMVCTGFLVFQVQLAAQAIIGGTVRDDSTGAPLSGVEVVIEGSDRRTTSDNAGRYQVEVAPGTHVALFRLIGFRPVRMRATLARGDTLDQEVRLLREGIARLDPVEVTARPERPLPMGRDAFEVRRRLGFGKFIDSAEMRRADGRRLSEVLRRTGVRMVNFKIRHHVEIRAASPVRSSDCWVTVILDGVTIFRSGRDPDPPDFSRDFRPETLESIEYYRSPAATPIEFGGAAADCGVLVMWSRRG
jgi:iron complex outermembrane receptor protein